MAAEKLLAIEFHKYSTEENNSDKFLRNLLDDVEKRVEKLRDQAVEMEQEKESLLATLQKIQDNDLNIEFKDGEREEIEANAERLICRCLTVEVNVTTPRNEIQERALQRTKEILQNLKGQIKIGKHLAVETAKSYLNSCSSEPEGTIIDYRFQGLVLECTADDQKKIRKHLKEMIKGHENSLDENCML